ncbi:cyanophycinase [Pseudidiomarina insulisalsae]|uniref:Cyanophycinase n=1 Tax=Pseudidiomarina insulisalsae TaxID=575789 RepID=A0A432YQX4_9GAMM|nr:cyanophycinase [Pseudidiomarina insulisalsae]RUO63682.1 cyanophycinase [Pseudidiomarina insulisalsae]
MRKAMFTCALALTAVFGGTTVQAQEKTNFYPLVLLGERLEVCSSMAWQRCNDTDWIDRDAMRSDRYLNLSNVYLEPLLDIKNWGPLRSEVRDDVKEAIELLRNRVNQDVISERVFLEEFTRRATRYLYDQLSEADWNMIIDHLEMRVPTDVEFGVNLMATKEQVQLDFLRDIVSQAKQVSEGETPHVLVVTAAQRDSLDLVNYYLQTFAGAGADASWLPLDKAVLAAREDNACEVLDEYRPGEMGAYRRAAVHADLHVRQVAFCDAGDALTQIRNADAIYFADGNPDLLRPLLVTPFNEPNELAVGIAERIAEEQLIVAAAGMSANVMTSRAMVTGGSSAAALREGVHATRAPGLGCDKDDTCPRNLREDSATYHPMGGAGLFRFGTLDTNMGEQGNHGRLLRVAATNRVPLAVGIDAATALLVNLRSGDFKVTGERGVFFAAGAQQNELAVASTFHYLMAGSNGSFAGTDLTEVSFAEDAQVVQVEPTTNFISSRGLYDSLRLLCRDRETVEVKWQQFTMTLIGGEGTETALAGAECQVQNARIGMQYAPAERF